MKTILLTLLSVFSISVVLGQELTLFDRPNTIILLSMPANENEFQNIFQRSPEQGELNNIVTLLNQYKDFKNVYILNGPDDLEKIMKTIMSKADNKKYDEYIPRIGFSVVGHNDKGNFYFPNGIFMKLEDVEKKLYGSPAMFLSCNAKKYGVTGVDYKLTYSEALTIASDIDNIVTEMHDKRTCNIYFDPPRKIATTMLETLNNKSRIKYTAKFLGAAGGLTGGFVLLKQVDTPENKQQTDSSAIVTMPADSMATENSSSIGTPSFIDSSKEHHIGRNPASVPEEQKPAIGTAMVYCPAKMIKSVPCIVNATISKDELAEAFTKYNRKIQQLNPDKKKENISSNIKGDTIDIYERMGVTLEFDPEDFKQISDNDSPTKAFKNKNALEWEWVIKPLHSTRKSIINFKFYYIDPNDSSTNYIFQKTISIDVSVDARSFVDKWKDFLLDDPKTTTTAIVIPLVTFLGGFLTGKKKEKRSIVLTGN